ncbi:hypothetical protein BGZ60DRAFT_80605 [Tricladium varicosporioides]|nr:hypothetical protein BGZ60DRAFT_80605 [Hymenoscyphus varicosporioides]
MLASPLTTKKSLNKLCNSEPRKYLMTSCQSGGLSYLPKLGFNLPLKILRAVLFPIPLDPTKPKTCPGRGVAPNGHFFGQIPHPIQRLSEMKAIFDSGVTSMQRRPLRTTGQDFLHSCLHFYSDCISTVHGVRESARSLPLVCTVWRDFRSAFCSFMAG